MESLLHTDSHNPWIQIIESVFRSVRRWHFSIKVCCWILLSLSKVFLLPLCNTNASSQSVCMYHLVWQRCSFSNSLKPGFPAVTFPYPPHHRFDRTPAHQCSCSKCSIVIWSDVDLPYPSLANSESCSSLLQPREVIPEDWILLISSRALARESRSPESWCWASHRLRITDDGLSWHAK